MVNDLAKQNPSLLNGRLTAIKEQLPSYIDWTELKMAVAFIKGSKKSK